MTTITVRARQTVFDIALEQYGTCEAVGEILALNPDIANDPAALAQMGIDSVSETGFYMDAPVDKGMLLRIDEDSPLIRKNVLKELTNEITTYQYGTND